jgi:long-chain acyl-CoA synthetase
MEITRVFDILERLRTYAPKADILNAKENGKWRSYSLDDFIESVNCVGAALLQMGLEPGDKVAIMAANSPQWNFVDFGAQQVGMVSAPLFPTVNDADLLYILNHSEAKIIFVSERAGYARLAKLEGQLPHLRHVVSFRQIEGVSHFSEFIELGRRNCDMRRIDAIRSKVSGADLLTLLYTSGTTGQPKGVMISHSNLLENVFICKDIAPFTTKWRALSFLPLNHVYERFLNTLYLYHGVSIYYAESLETIGENCREIHPHIFVAVPRVLEKVLERIVAAGEKLTGLKKKIFGWSLRLAERYELNGANGLWYELQRKVANKIVYKKWRAAVGGEVQVIVSGGAALNPRIERVFTCAGFNLLQGYGLTETCVVVAVNRFETTRRKFGTVGLVVENSDVKIAEDDGEILVRGPSVMAGYYKNPEATAEVIDKNGWFHTGDIGTFVDGKFLRITDRKKEIFKTTAGKYISPASIENRLKECRFIEQCMVVGDSQKFASALIVPSLPAFRDYCERSGISWDGEEAMRMHEALKRLIDVHVKTMNTSLSAFEQIKRPQILEATWGVDSGELTPKLSLRRKIILERNRGAMSKIYGSGED